MPVVRPKCIPFLLFLALFFAALQLWAQSATTTTLSVSPASGAWATAVTLTATVTEGGATVEPSVATATAGGTPVTPGLVKFCNAAAAACQGSAFLGQAQLTANGTATLKLALSNGPQSIKAEFAGTLKAAASSSSVETVTLAAPITLFGAVGVASSPYTLSTAIQGVNLQPITGTVSIVDQSNGNYSLGTATLGKTATSIYGFAAGAAQTLPVIGSEPIPLVIGDFNGDGYPDIAVGNVNPNANGVSSITLFLSAGNYFTQGVVFGNPISLTLPSYVSGVNALAVGDFNNDGKLDLAIASGNANYVTIMLGDGTGNFTFGTALPTGTDPNSIAVGDFNHDGNADLAITNQFSSSVTILLGNGQDGFTEVSSPPATGAFPYSVAVGDFNGDGKQDLAVANYYSNSVSILLGNGDGTFTAGATPATGSIPVAVAVGDFNGDGKQDLAVVNQYSKNLSILLGDGTGNFNLAATPATGNHPDSIVVGDLNNDGIEDLAIANSADNTITILFGKGDGTFPNSQSGQTGSAPNSVAIANSFATGVPVLYTADSGDNTIALVAQMIQSSASATVSGITIPGGGVHTIAAVFSGDASYTAATSSTITLAGTPITSRTSVSIEPSGTVAVGDTVQLTAAISPSPVGKLTPSGTASFYNGATLLGKATVTNGVGVFNYTLTAAGVESLSVKYSGDANFLASASGAAPLTVIAPQASTTTLIVSSNSVNQGMPITLTATVTSGGKPVTQGIVLFGFCSGTNTFCEAPDPVILGNSQLVSSGTATLKATLPVGVYSVYAIFQGTTDILLSKTNPDQIVTVSDTATNTALAVTGTQGNYTATATVSGTWYPPQGTVSFVDTTNKNLVLFSAQTHLNAPQFTLSEAVPTGSSAGEFAVAAADFNGDGKQDFAVTHGDQLSILLGNGDGTFTASAQSPSTGKEPVCIVAGDFNGDGKIDLAVSNSGSNTVTILLGNGDGTFTLKSSPAVGAYPTGMVSGDFNADGKLDLAVVNYESNTVSILLGNGDGTFTLDPEPAFTGLAPWWIVSADFNGDGKLDLAVTDLGSNTVTILLGNGDGTFTPASLAPVTAKSPSRLAVGDFNGDSRPDLAVITNGSSVVEILLGNGDGTFTPTSSSPNGGASPSMIIAGDFNGDGATDLATTNQTGGTVTILVNTGNGTFQPVTVAVGSNTVPSGIAAADFNHDGSPDLVITGGEGAVANYVLLNKTTTGAQYSSFSVPGSGTHEIEAVFTGQSPYASSTSNSVAVTASSIATSTSITGAPSVVPAGTTITVTVNVSPASAFNYTLGGNVSLYDGATLIGMATPSNGQATFSIVLSAFGTHELIAKYANDTNFAASISTLDVHVAGTTATTLTVSANSVSAGTPVTLSAAVTAGGTPVTQGVITFCDAALGACENSAVLGSANLTSAGTAILKLRLGIGTHSMKAVFAADAAGQNSVSSAQAVVVKGLYSTTTTLTDSANSGTYTLTATVNGYSTQAPSGSVSFINAPANTTAGIASLHAGTTTLSFSGAASLTSGATPIAVAVADFNRDGIPDIAVVNSGSNNVSIYLGNGDGTFTAKSTPGVGSDPITIAAGDFNAGRHSRSSGGELCSRSPDCA